MSYRRGDLLFRDINTAKEVQLDIDPRIDRIKDKVLTYLDETDMKDWTAPQWQTYRLILTTKNHHLTSSKKSNLDNKSLEDLRKDLMNSGDR